MHDRRFHSFPFFKNAAAAWTRVWLKTALLVLLAVLLAQSARAQSVGDVLPPAAHGDLDIHHINTGEGSAAFLILPDATTLLIDCGSGHDITRPPRFKAPRKPDDSRLPGEWVARYIRQVHPRGDAATIDYGVVSHFHSDHMGGVAELFRHVRIEKLIDRGWPDYTVPVPFTGPLAALYKVAVTDQVNRHGMKVERFKVGAADQIVLRRAPDRFSNFEVRNLAVNGDVWTGEGALMRQRVDALEKPNENACSAALRVRYGRFDYFTGGDLPGTSAQPDVPAWRDLESAIAWVTGPVDVAVLNHHGNADSSSAFFLSALQPRVCIAQVWDAQHVAPKALARLRSDRVYPGPRDIFMTNGRWEGRAEHIVRVFGETVGSQHIEDLKSITADQGHIVVRVAAGGDSYRIIVLDDTDEARRIRSLHGPYPSR